MATIFEACENWSSNSTMMISFRWRRESILRGRCATRSTRPDPDGARSVVLDAGELARPHRLSGLGRRDLRPCAGTVELNGGARSAAGRWIPSTSSTSGSMSKPSRTMAYELGYEGRAGSGDVSDPQMRRVSTSFSKTLSSSSAQGPNGMAVCRWPSNRASQVKRSSCFSTRSFARSAASVDPANGLQSGIGRVSACRGWRHWSYMPMRPDISTQRVRHQTRAVSGLFLGALDWEGILVHSNWLPELFDDLAGGKLVAAPVPSVVTRLQQLSDAISKPRHGSVDR